MSKKFVAAIIILLLFTSISSALADDTYTEISTPEELAAISDDPGGRYILTGDIDMKGIQWTPIKFNGVLDGAGYTIYNLSITELGSDSEKTYDGNQKEYEAYFAGLFSAVRGAKISNLNILNIKVDISTGKNCFIGGLAGFAEDTIISGCNIKGRIKLYQTNTMCGVAGIIGFGNGSITCSSSDTELVFIDGDTKIKCEEFLGGILACGYTDIKNCSVTLKGYASIQGYAHNGGITGMYYVYKLDDKNHAGYVCDNTVDASISFYEDNTDRRAYCKAAVGEKLNKFVSISNNTVIKFNNLESFNYKTVLLPDMCKNPVYKAVITQPTCTGYGYTAYTCSACGYTYTDNYTHPAHIPGQWVTTVEPTYKEAGKECLYCSVCGQLLEERELPVHVAGEWVTVREPAYEEPGLKQKRCTVCGQLLEEEEIPCLIHVSSCTLNVKELSLNYKSSSSLRADIQPAEASNKKIIWSTSNAKVVTVDEEGILHAVGRGSAVITAACADGNASSECTVIVKYTFWQWIIIILLFGWLWY